MGGGFHQEVEHKKQPKFYAFGRTRGRRNWKGHLHRLGEPKI